MANFTSQTKLKQVLQANQVDAIFTAVPETERQALFEKADALIKGITKYIPYTDATANHQLLELCASYLVVWFATGAQQGISEDERKKRKENFDWTMETLAQIRDGDISVTGNTDDDDEPTGPQYRSDTPNISAW